jgi:phosphoglycolate phosphatase
VTDSYEAVVYDLDGTLVRLDVDWDAVRGAVATRLREEGRSVDGDSLWTLLERQAGSLVGETIAEHERAGARTSERLPLADELPLSVPVAVCSLNAESACRVALERHGLDSHVDAVVGRDTVETYKPDPEPLLHAVGELAATPERTLFVGDTDRDARTAERAGVPFEFASDRL